MKILLCLVSILFIPSSQAVGTNPAQTPFVLAISAQEDALSGAEIVVRVTLTNTSDSEISLLESNPECDYATVVRKDGDGLATETAYKRNLDCDDSLRAKRRFLKKLKPGQSLEDRVTISMLNDMTQPGRYFVSLSRKIPQSTDKGYVKSNEIMINVGR